MDTVIKESLSKAMSYTEFRGLVKDLLSKGKSTGKEQTESLLNYSKLNDSRMKRLDKTSKLSEDTVAATKNIQKEYTWLVLTEGWCGDAAQTLPIINKIAELSDKINLKVVLRDHNEDLMNKFLTNGNRSIPKLIAIDNASNQVVADWGPRPSIATDMVNDYKKEHGRLDAEFKKDLQIWYNKNKGGNTQDDILKLLRAS